LRFYTRTPSPPLSNYIALFWYYEGYETIHKKERLLPDGSMELVVNLNEDETRMYDPEDPSRCIRAGGSVMVGPRDEHFIIDTEEQMRVAGIHFHPGGAYPFLGMPASEMYGQDVPLQDFWGASGRSLRERLLEAPTPERKFDVMEKQMWHHLRKELRRHPATAYALREIAKGPGVDRIARLTEQVGLSSRRFIEVFRQEVGLTPKVFCRVRRFQRVLRTIAADARSVDWTQIALSCGYFDQAHFIHDFKAFSGLNPTTYLALRTPHLNHVPLEES
jgi:AraC-like DNA-binding protein